MDDPTAEIELWLEDPDTPVGERMARSRQDLHAGRRCRTYGDSYGNDEFITPFEQVEQDLRTAGLTFYSRSRSGRFESGVLSAYANLPDPDFVISAIQTIGPTLGIVLVAWLNG